MGRGPISMPLRDWLFVDAVMDNTGQNAIEVNEDQIAARAHAIRDKGWSATGHITRPISAAGVWPPGDDVLSEQVTVSLTLADWRFAVEHLRVNGGIAESIGHVDEAAQTRLLADRIADHLAEPRA